MSAVLQNEFLSLSLDARGNLASLRNRKSDCEYLSAPGLDLWRVVCPLADNPEAVISATDQREVEFAVEGARIAVRYPDLRDSEGKRIGVAFGYEVEIRGEELIFVAQVENRSGPPVNELWFPMIGGLGSLGAARESFLLYPESAGRRIIDPLRNLADRNAQPLRGVRPHFLRDFYPGRASMQWMGLYGREGSLYVGSHDATLQTTATNAMLNVGGRPDRDSLSLGFIKYPFAAARERWQSEPFVVAVHAGPWRDDARRYRRFADTYQDHARRRAGWVEDMEAMQDIVMLHQHGRVNYRYDRIPEICAAAASGEVRVVKLTGWSHGGHDNMYPDFLPSELLGGEAALAGELRRARDRGFRMVLYFHFVQMSPNSEFYKTSGEFCAIKGPQGNPFIDVFTWPGDGSILGMNERVQLINACVDTEPWQRQVLDCVRRGLDWGADCVFLDQTAGGPSSFLCFDRRHGHPNPAFACGPGKTRLSRLAREMVKARSEEAALGAEYIADVILQFYDFTIPFGSGFFFGEQHFGEMYRYTFPEDVICTQYMSREDYRQLHYSFVMGYRFFLAPRQQCEVLTAMEPAFVDRLAKLVRLRRRHAARLLRGRFRETAPLAIGNPALVARAFEAPEGGAVAVWNPTDRPQELAVTWPGRTLAAAETPDGALPAAGASLAPDEVAVMLFT